MARTIHYAVVALLFASACGGGSSGSPSSPSAPSTPTPTPTSGTLTVYPSVEEPASISSHFTHWADFVDPFPPHKWLDVGWNYFDAEYPPYGRDWSGFAAALKFDVSGIAGRTVTKATLRLYVYRASRDSKLAPLIKVNALSGNWDPDKISWNVLQGISYHTSSEAQVPTPAATGLRDWDVTGIVRNWASGTWTNYGLKLSVDRYTDPGYVSWASISLCATGGVANIDSPECERPQLIIEYQ